MNDSDTNTNSASFREPPFVGRREIYARLQQHILDPPDRHAHLFLGYDSIGKSALLWQLPRVYDDTLLGVYFALDIADDDEDGWLQRLVERTNQMLAQHQFSLTRIPQVHVPDDTAETDDEPPFNWREWLCEDYLPEVLRVIRPHRRLVWLFDDATYLIDKLPDDHVSYLYRLLQAHPQLAMVLTLHSRQEARLPQFAPLVDVSRVERLPRLNADESGELIAAFMPGAADALKQAAHRMTGGHPLLLQRLGDALYDLVGTRLPSTPAEQDELLKRARKPVYDASLEEFSVQWQALDRDERLVLTALSSLRYDDPLRPVAARDIEAWLIETDYPMDIITINAALRSLSYRDVVTVQQEEIALVTGLFQSWLLEYARLDRSESRHLISEQPSRGLMLALAVLVILVIVLGIVMANRGTGGGTPLALPTVTLSG